MKFIDPNTFFIFTNIATFQWGRVYKRINIDSHFTQQYLSRISNEVKLGTVRVNQRRSTRTLELLANFFNANLPFNFSAKDVGDVYPAIANASIDGGSYHSPSSLNLTEAYDLAVRSIEAASSNLVPFNNGWYHNLPQGLYGTSFIDRVLVAQVSCLELILDQVIYHMRKNCYLQLNSNISSRVTSSGTAV